MVANAMPIEVTGQIWGEYSLRKSMSKYPGECTRFIFFSGHNITEHGKFSTGKISLSITLIMVKIMKLRKSV